MIDTVKLRSPYLAAEQAAEIEQQLTRRLAVQISSGEVLWQLTSEELVGSWENRIMVRICREEVRCVEPAQGRRRAVYEPCACPPFLLVEGSVHKALSGHNITGGPLGFQEVAAWFISLVSQLLWSTLPAAALWAVDRVDKTECYRLPFEAVQEFIASLNAAQYPRRKAHRYGSEAIFFPGTTTAVKVYHKGPEFAKHDAKRLRGLLDPDDVVDLQKLANGIMRAEVSIKAKKLKADFGEKPLVSQVTDAYLQQVHDREVARVLREGRQDMETVRTATEVKRRLNKLHSTQLASTLYGVWSQLATIGEFEVRRDMAKATWYKYRKCLISAGVSWAGTDINVTQSCIPPGFSLCRQSPFRDQAEDPRIADQLAAYRVAA